MERFVFRRVYSTGSGRMCSLFWSIWAYGPAQSDDYPGRTETRLLLPVALCFALAPSTIARDSRASHRSSGGHSRIATSSVSVRRRRKELEAKTNRGPDGAVTGDYIRHVYASRRVHPLESAYERLERRSRAVAIFARHNRTRTARRSGSSG